MYAEQPIRAARRFQTGGGCSARGVPGPDRDQDQDPDRYRYREWGHAGSQDPRRECGTRHGAGGGLSPVRASPWGGGESSSGRGPSRWGGSAVRGCPEVAGGRRVWRGPELSLYMCGGCAAGGAAGDPRCLPPPPQAQQRPPRTPLQELRLQPGTERTNLTPLLRRLRLKVGAGTGLGSGERGMLGCTGTGDAGMGY